MRLRGSQQAVSQKTAGWKFALKSLNMPMADLIRCLVGRSAKVTLGYPDIPIDEKVLQNLIFIYDSSHFLTPPHKLQIVLMLGGVISQKVP